MGRKARKPVFVASEKARLKPRESHQSQRIARIVKFCSKLKFRYDTFQ